MAPSLDRLTTLFKAVDKDLVVNWQALVAASARSSIVHLTHNGKQLNDVLLLWYTHDGLPVCHRNVDPSRFPVVHNRLPQKGDLAVTVGEAAADGFRHPWLSEDRVQTHWPTKPVQLMLPAYDVKSRFLLLDGAHRSIATLRSSVEYDVELALIHGPVDEYILRDLAVFA